MPDFGIINTRDITFENSLKALGKDASLKKPEVDGASFSDILKKSVLEVDAMQKQADFSVNEMVAGDKKDIHETMINLEKADVSFKLMMRVRNKIIEAYREVMRMNI
jgi:flagellar hook-basal body complex protein FliE